MKKVSGKEKEATRLAEEEKAKCDLENAYLKVQLDDTRRQLQWTAATARVEAAGRTEAERAYVALRAQVLGRRRCLPARVKRARDNASINVRRLSPFGPPPREDGMALSAASISGG